MSGQVFCSLLCNISLFGGGGVPFYRSFPGGTIGKESTCQHRGCRRCGFNPWIGKIPWRRAWQPTPIFLPGESHGERSLAGYSQWDCKEWDTTEAILICWYSVYILDTKTLSDICLVKFLCSTGLPIFVTMSFDF